jgi:hypothetical protein
MRRRLVRWSKALERQGIRCWIAPPDVTPGSQYADEIIGAINDAKVLVLVLSQHAVASSHVGKEVERASSKRRRIIALRTDAAALTRALEYFLSESQWIDVPSLGMQAALAKLAQAMGQALSAPSQDLPTPGPALATSGVSATKRLIRARRVTLAAAIFFAFVVAVALGVHFWPSKHPEAQSIFTAAVISDKSIAVLPFADMSEKKDQEYFAEGMVEELLDVLEKIPQLKVIGRTSSFQFKNKSDDLRTIGKALGVAHVVEGSVRRNSTLHSLQPQSIWRRPMERWPLMAMRHRRCSKTRGGRRSWRCNSIQARYLPTPCWVKCVIFTTGTGEPPARSFNRRWLWIRDVTAA